MDIKSYEEFNITEKILAEAKSINKIQKEWTKVTTTMKDTVEQYKTAEGKDKEVLLTQLKKLSASKRKLEYELDSAVGLKDADIELKESILNEVKSQNLKRLEQLYSEIVPGKGNAKTVGGEVVRAVGRINYRYFNDGDVFFTNYGAETAGPAMAYLMTDSSIPREYRSAFMKAARSVEMLQLTGYELSASQSKAYEKFLDRIITLAVDLVDGSPTDSQKPNNSNWTKVKSKWEEGDYGEGDDDDDDYDY